MDLAILPLVQQLQGGHHHPQASTSQAAAASLCPQVTAIKQEQQGSPPDTV